MVGWNCEQASRSTRNGWRRSAGDTEYAGLPPSAPCSPAVSRKPATSTSSSNSAPRTPGLLSIAAMELELADLFGGREVELRTYEDLSTYFRDEARARANTLYDAA